MIPQSAEDKNQQVMKKGEEDRTGWERKQPCTGRGGGTSHSLPLHKRRLRLGHLRSGDYPREDWGTCQEFETPDEGLEEERGGGRKKSWGVKIKNKLSNIPWEKMLELLKEARVGNKACIV